MTPNIIANEKPFRISPPKKKIDSSANNVVLQMDGKDNPAQYYSAFVWDSAYLNTSQDLQSLFDLVRSKIS